MTPLERTSCSYSVLSWTWKPLDRSSSPPSCLCTAADAFRNDPPCVSVTCVDASATSDAEQLLQCGL